MLYDASLEIFDQKNEQEKWIKSHNHDALLFFFVISITALSTNWAIQEFIKTEKGEHKSVCFIIKEIHIVATVDETLYLIILKSTLPDHDWLNMQCSFS